MQKMTKKKSPRSDIDHTETDSGGIIWKLKMVYIFKDRMIRNKGLALFMHIHQHFLNNVNFTFQVRKAAM